MEFKLRALELSRITGVQVHDEADALDDHPFLVQRWREEARESL